MSEAGGYRFESVKLTGCPPIGDLELNFSDKLNLVVGQSGSGKSAIVQALRTGVWPHGGNVSIRGKGRHDIVRNNWTNVLVDELCGPGWIDNQQSDYWTRLCRDDPTILRRVSELLIDLVQNKLGAATKFKGIPDCGSDMLSVEVDAEGSVAVCPGPSLLAAEHRIPGIYSGFGDLFVGMGERCLIHFSGVIAVREHLRLAAPLILDGVFGLLDLHHQYAVMSLLHALDQQVIVFENASCGDQLERYCRPGDSVIRPRELNRGELGPLRR